MSTEKMMKEFIEAFVEQYGFGRMAASSNPDAAAMLACAEWAWFKSRAAIEVELRDAYMKGWEASGEGWNGEYPEMLHETERWQSERDQALGLRVKPC